VGLLNTVAEALFPNPKIEAQYAPPVMTLPEYTSFNYYGNAGRFVTRQEALSVPSVKKARDLICGIIGTTEFHLYRKSTGQELGSPVWLEQPDRNQPRQVTMAYTADSLFFYGVAYWEVVEQYADGTGRPSRFAWVANERVTPRYNENSTLVIGYAVDGRVRPMDGLGSLITFQSLNDGILSVGGQTIRAALDAQYAASVNARTPIQSGYIKNTGADLPEDQIVGLLAKWKQSRLQNNVGYLNAALDFKTTSFSPKEMGYNEFLQFLATEIARMCNIPAYMLSADLNNSLTYANVIDERRQFVDMSLRPYIEAIEGRLSMNDITSNQNYVRAGLDDGFLRSDALTRLQVTEKLLSLGLITIEQAREMEDLSPNGSDTIDV